MHDGADVCVYVCFFISDVVVAVCLPVLRCDPEQCCLSPKIITLFPACPEKG